MSEPRRIGDVDLDKVQATLRRLQERSSGKPVKQEADQPPEPLPPGSEPQPEASATKTTPLAQRVTPSKRAQIEALNRVAERRGQNPVDTPPISYYSPELIQCTLPHTDPKTRDWARKNGNFSLVVSSGVDDELQPFGVPFGSFPRLVLAHIITRVIATQERHIELSSHFSSFLKEIGYIGNHRGKGVKGQRLHHQLNRLLHANISFQYKEGDEESGRRRVHQMNVAPDFDLWWNYKVPEQGSLFGSWVEISQEFYEAIRRSPVPLRTDILKEIKKSPLAIDVYMWVSYRLFTMHATKKRELFVPISALQNQFGTGYAEANYRQFRGEFRSAFGKVAALWHHGNGPNMEKSLLQYEITEDGLFLAISPLLIGRGDRLTDQEEAQAILSARQFDGDTLRKARFHSGKWSLERLQADYFDWISEKGITPTDPRAHFIDFVKTHVKSNP